MNDLAWAAGIFDGEGSVSIYGETSRSTNVQLRVGMTHKPTMTRFIEIIGGGGTLYTTKQGIRTSKKRMWWWAVSNKATAKVMALLLPFSTTKHGQLEVALEFRKLIDTRNTRRLTDEQMQERLRFKDLLLEAREADTEPW